MGVGGFSSTEVQQRSVRRARWLGYDGWAYGDGFTGDGAERVRHVNLRIKRPAREYTAINSSAAVHIPSCLNEMTNPMTTPPDSRFTGSTPPRIRKTTTDAGYRSSNLAKSRVAVLSDLGRVPQIPLDAMMQMLIPPLLSAEDVEAIIEDLTREHVITDNRWTAFDPNPSASSEREPDFFRERLPGLCRAIVGAARRVASGSLPATGDAELQMDGSQTPSSFRQNTSRPDGYYALRGASPVGWPSIAIPFEVKKKCTKALVRDVCL